MQQVVLQVVGVWGAGGGRNFSTYIGHWTHHSHLALSVHLERDQHVCIDLHILNPSCFCLSSN